MLAFPQMSSLTPADRWMQKHHDTLSTVWSHILACSILSPTLIDPHHTQSYGLAPDDAGLPETQHHYPRRSCSHSCREQAILKPRGLGIAQDRPCL